MQRGQRRVPVIAGVVGGIALGVGSFGWPKGDQGDSGTTTKESW